MGFTIDQYRLYNIIRNKLSVFALVIFFIISNDSYAQNNFGNYNIKASFDTLPLKINQGEIISKVLQIINTNEEKETSFSISVTYPAGWKILTLSDRMYTIPAQDTMYIPIRIVPQGRILGNTKYLIYSYIINENNLPVASAHFFAEKPKLVSWDINIKPDNKIYLLNDENSARFAVNLFNSGNESQDLILDLATFRKDRIMLMDTNGRIVKKPIYSLTLPQLEDTNFHFEAKFINDVRNYRIVDTEGYIPSRNGKEQKYSLFVKSRESALSGTGSVVKGKKVDLIKLPDEVKVNSYGYSALPLTFESNISNILGTQPIMNVILRGSTFLNNGAYINYNATTYFSSYFASSQFLTGSFINLGYYTDKYNIQVGNVGGFGGGGKGISGNYFISKQQAIGGYIAKGPKLFGSQSYLTSAGLNYRFSTERFRYNSSYSHVVNTRQQLNSDYLRNGVSVSLTPKHSIGTSFSLRRADSYSALNPYIRYGYSTSASYSGKFINNKLNTSISGTYADNANSISGQGRSYGLNHSSGMFFNEKLTLRLTNYYQHSIPQDTISPDLQLFNNTLFLNAKIREVSIAPSFFYNVATINQRGFHSRGINISQSKFDLESNRMIGANLRMGYNKVMDMPELKDFFFLQSFFVFRYRVWSANLRYTYGSIAATDLRFLSGTYPQSVGASVNHQHQFKNPHFVLNSNVSYNYTNIYRKNTIGYTGQLYYYTKNGWRFYVQPGYYVGRAPLTGNAESDGRKANISHSFLINAGVKKDFGIPIPWIKTKYPTLTFESFIDHNGNGKQDKGEIFLDNVVVKLGEWETITNEKGRATFRNIYRDSTYQLAAFSLVDLRGYFPNIPTVFVATDDSLVSIPFVKGVKVHGTVFLDREKIAAGSDKPLDLSGIRITAINGKTVTTLTDGNGGFSLYVPFGKYTVTMDEKVLGNKYTLLQNNIELGLDQKTESIFITFYIVEKRRKVNVKRFDQNGKKVDGSEKTLKPKEKSIEDLLKEAKDKAGKDETGDISPTTKNVDDLLKLGDIDKSQIKFKVQIGSYNTNVPNPTVDKIRALGNVDESKTEFGLTRFTSGNFSDYQDAKTHRQEVIDNPNIDSDPNFIEVVGDYKGKFLTADEAKLLMNLADLIKDAKEQKEKNSPSDKPTIPNQNQPENKPNNEIPETGSQNNQGTGTAPQNATEPTNDTSINRFNVDKSKVNFKVQIGVFNPEDSNPIIEKIKQLDNIKEDKTEDGLVRFTHGEFKSINAAKDYRRKLINQGIDADTTFIIVVGEYKGKQITADEAQELLKD